jgi:secreted PhoX family phosphatase
MNRRRFLGNVAAAAALPGLERVLAPLLGKGSDVLPFDRWQPIPASDADELLLPDGFRYDVVIKWGDPFTASGEGFGYNNDWIGVFDLKDGEQALLAVNHEYVSLAQAGDAPLYPDTFQVLRRRPPGVEDFKGDVGLSVVRVRRDGRSGAWAPVTGDLLNRRIDATTPCLADGPASPLLGEGIEGTLANCGGQVTPWSTALTCEENYQEVVPDLVDARGHSARGGLFDLPGAHYGWVVEIDPYDPASAPVKHTAMGRFRHENVGLRAEAGKPVAAYMGDDRIGGHVWKFVSDGLYRPGDPDNRRLLSFGKLYVARFRHDGTGEWRLLDVASPLDPNPDPSPKPFVPACARKLGDCYASQGALLMDAYKAANAIGGSPSGRPEDLEVHPADGSVFISFTSISGLPGLWENAYGEVWRIQEEGDARSGKFKWARFCAGGPSGSHGAANAFAQPDNLVFDKRGELWMCSDMPSALMNQREDYKAFGNGGVFRIPLAGPDKGRPLRFASFPCEAEATGPAWSQDASTLFISVQHPGERFGTRRQGMPSPRGSNWPDKRLGAPPQPAVVSIRRS